MYFKQKAQASTIGHVCDTKVLTLLNYECVGYNAKDFKASLAAFTKANFRRSIINLHLRDDNGKSLV